MTDDDADIWGLDESESDDKVKRDGLDRPYVYPAGYTGELSFARTKPKGSPRMSYTRTTTYVDCLDDKTALEMYYQRNVIRGIVAEPALLMRASDIIRMGDVESTLTKQQLNHVAKDARSAIYEDAKADAGTFVHLLCQVADEELARGATPAEALGIAMQVEGAETYREDIAAYLRLTVPLMRPVLIEVFLVVDGIKVAGTVDRINQWIGPDITAPDGTLFTHGDYLTCDIKTGTVDFGAGKFCMQMSVYSHGEIYDQTTNTRTPLPPVNQGWAIVIHVPKEQGTATLLWADTRQGWDAVSALAGPVRAWRNASKKLLTAFPESTLADRVRGALTEDEARQLYFAHKAEWTTELTELAKGKAA